jgi:para-aminobenzoate synthetase component 1
MTSERVKTRVCMRPILTSATPAQALVSFSRAARPVVLESTLASGAYGRYSIFACEPVDVIEVPSQAIGSADVFTRLAGSLTGISIGAFAAPQAPFSGGWIGYVSYEAGLCGEGVRAAALNDVPVPQARFGLYAAAAIFDHVTSRWYGVATECAADPRLAHEAQGRLDRMEYLVGRAEVDVPLSSRNEPSKRSAIAELNFSPAEYLAKARRAIRYIEAGDIYQVNLSTRFSSQTTRSPLEVYQRLRRACPAPFSAFLPYDDFAVLSCSPELFLTLRDGVVVTRPIKGTRPRGRSPAEDLRQRRALVASQKDRAELNMIVDLLRNDVGRVCEFGTVRVGSEGTIETHPNVFHRVATIEGRLDSQRSWADLLRATSPGGSVTGVPKIRATEIISELEPTTRGVYCGAIGWIGLDGSVAFNLAIRTMVHCGGLIHAYAGSAITADSDPEDEYREICTKAGRMLSAMDCSFAAEDGEVEPTDEHDRHGYGRRPGPSDIPVETGAR